MLANNKPAEDSSRVRTLYRFPAMLFKPASLLLLVWAPPLLILAFSRIVVVDGAYISFRYAHNLAMGHGLVVNPGETVEGFSSLLWTLIMVVPEVFGLSVHTVAAFLGVGFGLLALIAVWRICRRLGISSWGTLTAVTVIGRVATASGKTV